MATNRHQDAESPSIDDTLERIESASGIRQASRSAHPPPTKGGPNREA